MMPTASISDTVRVLSTVVAPLVAQGAIVRRPRVLALAEWMDADRRAGRLLRALRGKYGPEPLRLRVPGRPVALVLTPESVREVLLGSPVPYAPANREKVAALRHFQPHGVLVSRGPARAARRELNEAVLDTGQPVHRLGDTFARVVREEAVLPADLDWDGFTAMWTRTVRRIVLGDGARDDEELTELLTLLRRDANWAYLRRPRTALRGRFADRVRSYVTRAEPGSLVANVPAGSQADLAGQVPHWLFAFDAAGIAAYRALALLPDEPADLPYLRAAVLESVRLWPTTMVILRDSTEPVAGCPAGTAFVIVSSYFQRDPVTLPYADRFAPEIWLDGRGQDNWSLVPFSAGPVRCPGQDLVLFTTGTLLAALRERYSLRPLSPLDPAGPLPGTLDHTGLRFAVRERVTAS